MSSKKLGASNYAAEIIENHLTLEKISNLNPQKVQKHKFKVLEKLVSDMFEYRTSPKCYNTISNLIVVSLSHFDERAPLDIYCHHKAEPLIHAHDNFCSILQDEIKENVEPNHQCHPIEVEFKETVCRFLKQYDRVNNLEFTPILDKDRKELPN